MRMTVIGCVLGLSVCVIWAGTAGAGDALEPVDLPMIVVTTGARMEQSPQQSGGNVTVLGQREISASGAGDLAGLLAATAGVFVTQKSTSRAAVADIRGFGDTADRNVLILVNGRKLNSADNAAVDLSLIPLEAVERVEIVRGAASVLYGDHAAGGVINIITKKGRGPVRGAVGASGGSYGTFKAAADIGGSEGPWSYFMMSRYGDNQGYRDNSDVLAKDGMARLDYTLSSRLSLGADLLWHKDSYGLPGGLNADGLMEYGRRGSDEPDNYGKTTDRMFGVSMAVRPWQDPFLDGKLTVDYSFRNQDSFGWYDYGVWGAYATKRQIDTHAFLTQYTQTGDVLDKRYSAVIGLDFYDINNDILGGGSGLSASSDDLTISKQETGLYTHGELELLPRVFAGAGIRYQKAGYVFDQRSGLASRTRRDPDETVRRVLARYEYAQGSNFYASVEETFRFLSTDEWYSTWTGLDTSLRHQTGIQYETGWKHDFSGMCQASIVPYWIENENEIYFDPAVSPGYNANYDRTLRRGVEMSGVFNLKSLLDAPRLKELTLGADFHFQKAQFQDGLYSGKDIPMAPRQQAGLSVNARLQNGFGISFWQRFVGSRYVINDAANSLPREKKYEVAGLRVSLVKKDWDCFVSVNNVFGRKYNDYAAKSAGESVNIEYYPAPERWFEAGMTVRF